jgi:hypothetical protein
MYNNDPYAAYIAKCKAPKDPSKVRYLINCFITGAKRGLTNVQIADRLNELKIKSLVGKRWSPNNVAMAVLKMVRFDEDSSLAHTFAQMLKSGDVTENELALLRSRTRSVAA